MSDRDRGPLEWVEDLPLDCPPKEAHSPENQAFFRLVSGDPPREEDFFSLRKLYPKREFQADECRVRALSLWDSFQACLNIQKTPRHRNEKMVRLILPPHSGVILKTGQKHHVSWWQTKGFDPIEHCEFLNV